MFEKLDALVFRFDELHQMLSDPEVIAETDRLRELTIEEADLRLKVVKIKRYQEVTKGIQGTKEILELHDPEMTELAHIELDELNEEKDLLEKEMTLMMLPEDPNDDKNIIMEIRGAAGGDEAQLFAGDLLNMYHRFADKQGWKFEILEANANDIGGYREVSIMISGHKVYSKLKYENGAHRVQRVPETETQGRVHTSTATVVVMPEAEEVDVEIEPGDLRIDVYRAGGAGGQHVNVTDSAVRITHEPTGIIVAMQEERSQLQNREKAMQVLRARVYDYYQSQAQAEHDSARKLAIGTGDRSERIRTYNYPQGRVTDHRIGLTLQKLDSILSGDLDEIIDALILYDQTQMLEDLNVQ